jgi:hypothetical protein
MPTTTEAPWDITAPSTLDLMYVVSIKRYGYSFFMGLDFHKLISPSSLEVRADIAVELKDIPHSFLKTSRLFSL